MNSFYRIKTLHISNFKSVENTVFDFEEKNLVIFDGPNGYGKTTVFEAIEIILTKTPRRHRYIELDARIAFVDSPIHKDRNQPIELTLVLQNDRDSITIKRFFDAVEITKTSKDNNIKGIFETSRLYINNEISTEDNLEKILNFESVNTLFNVLNYVEQDENTFFLKKNPKERYKMLSSLLGADNEILKLEKIKEISKQIGKAIKENEKALKSIETINKGVLASDGEDIFYKRLVLVQELAWDREKINNSDIDIHHGYLKELNRIKNIIIKKHLLKDISFLKGIKPFINDTFLDVLIGDYWMIANKDLLKKENDNRVEYDKRLEFNDALIEAIELSNYDFFNEKDAWKYLEEQNWQENKIDINQFKTKLNLLIIQRLALGEHAKILSNLKTKQQEFLLVLEENKKLVSLSDSECPICGYNWEILEKLEENIKATIAKIYKDYNRSNFEFEQLKEEVENNYLKSIKKKLILVNKELKEKIDELISKEDYILLIEKK